ELRIIEVNTMNRSPLHCAYYISFSGGLPHSNKMCLRIFLRQLMGEQVLELLRKINLRDLPPPVNHLHLQSKLIPGSNVGRKSDREATEAVIRIEPCLRSRFEPSRERAEFQ